MNTEPAKTQAFIFAENVETDEDIIDYLTIFYEENGVDGLTQALGHIARKKGMSDIAKKAHVSRQSLYRTLVENGKPNLATFDKVIHAMGFKLAIVAN